MKKRLLSMILALSMVLTFLPVGAVTAFADDGDENIVASGTCGAEGDGSNLKWTLDNEGTLTISGKGMMQDYEYTGSSNSMASWYTVRDQIKKIVVEKGVTSIGKCAFLNCYNLTDADIQDSVTRIGDDAFSSCQRLKNIEMSSSVTEIGEKAFSHCEELESIEIPKSVTIIDDYAFQYCKKLSSVKISENVTSIGIAAFSVCSFTSIKIPEKIKSIGSKAFGACKQLESIEIPKTIDVLGEKAFLGCTVLKTVKYNGTENEFKSSGWNDPTQQYFLWNAEILYAHTVTFKNGANNLGTQTVNYDAKIESAPTVTAPTGKYLTGWYKDEGCTQKFDLEQDTVKENLTLYAGFAFPVLTVKDATVTVNGNGTDTKEIPVDANVTVTFDDSTIADKNLEFGGWEIEGLSDDELAKIDKNAKSIEFTMPAGNVFVTATTKYPDQTVTVTNGTITATLNDNALTDAELNIQRNGNTTTANVLSGAKVTVTFDRGAFVDKNLEFVNWNIQGLLDEECSSDKESVSFTMPGGKNMKLTAVTKLPGQNLVVTNGTVSATLNDAKLSDDDMGLVKTGNTATASIRTGANVTVTLDRDALKKQNQEFIEWDISGLDEAELEQIDKTAEEITFTMPEEGNVTVKAVVRTPDQKLTVTNGTFTYKNAANEEVTGKTGTVPVGTKVTVTFDKDFFADSHLKFSYWDIDGLEDPNAYQNKETFTFTMPGNAVTLEAMPQDDSIDDAVAEVLGTTAMVTTAVAGTAVLAYTGYQLGTEFYLICLLPSGAKIPANTAQLAELVWTDAGEPAPAAVLPEDATEDQQAMAWAVESDLIDADKAPDASVSRIEVIKTWKKAQSVKAG